MIAEFFQIVGVNQMAPTNIAELIPYLLTVLVGVVLVSGAFRVLAKLADVFVNFRRW